MEERNIKIKIDSNAKDVAKDTNALGASIEKATNSTTENNQEVAKGNESYKTFKTQLREANAELQKQIQLTGESSQETIKAAKTVANLKDQMQFASDLSDKFNPDQKMKALGAATQVAGTGLQGVTAGMALFGGESADTQKQLLKVQAAMAFSDAISNLSNLGDQWKLLKATISSSTLMTKANTAATGAAAMIQNLFTGSVSVTTTGFKALKFAIAATGIGLLVVGVGLLVANFDKVSAVVLKFVPGLATAGKVIMSIVNSITDFIGVTSEADRAVDRLKANAEKRSKDIDRILKEDGSRYSESAKKKMAIEKQLQDDIAEGKYNEQKLRKEANFAMAEIDRENAENIIKKAKEDAEKLADEKEKINEKARVKKEAKDKEEADRAKKIADDKLAVEMKSAQEAVNILDELKKNLETPAQKEQREFEEKKAILKANNLSIKKLTIQHINKLTQIYKDEREKKGKEDLDYWEAEAEKAKQRTDEEIDRDKKVADAKKENQDRLVSQGEALIGNIRNLAGKNKAIQKAAIIADGGIALGKSVANTAEAVTKDLAKGAPFSMPLVALDIAVGATSAASIIKGTADSLKAIGSGGSISGGGGSSIPSIPQATPQVAFNNTAENQIGLSISKAQTDQPPIKVYVAESDVTDAQKNVKVLVEKNTL